MSRAVWRITCAVTSPGSQRVAAPGHVESRGRSHVETGPSRCCKAASWLVLADSGTAREPEEVVGIQHLDVARCHVGDDDGDLPLCAPQTGRGEPGYGDRASLVSIDVVALVVHHLTGGCGAGRQVTRRQDLHDPVVVLDARGQDPVAWLGRKGGCLTAHR